MRCRNTPAELGQARGGSGCCAAWLWLQSLGARGTRRFICHLAKACLQGCWDSVTNLVTILITALPILISKIHVVLSIINVTIVFFLRDSVIAVCIFDECACMHGHFSRV